MKSFLLVTSIFLISSLAFSTPQLSEGEYTYTGFEQTQLMKQRVVFQSDKEKKVKVDNFKNLGFTCRHQSSRYIKCIKHLKNFSLPQKNKEKIEVSFQGKYFKAGPLLKSDLISQAPSLNMYQYSQDVVFNFFNKESSFDKFLVYETSSLNKFVFTDQDSGKKIWINQTKEGNLSLSKLYKDKISQFDYDHYSISIRFDLVN